MAQTSGVTGIVLAGGRSSRFGRDKLTEDLRGRPLLHHAISSLAGVCTEIVVVAAPGADPPVPDAGIPLRIAHDAEPYPGPLGGLQAGLGRAASPLAVVVGGDMPEISPAVLEAMLEAAAGSGADAIVLAEGGERPPLPLVVWTEAGERAAAALLARGERSLKSFLEGLRVEALDAPVWRALDSGGGSLRDIDRPGDLNA